MAKREKIAQDGAPLSTNPFAALSLTLPEADLPDGPAADLDRTAAAPQAARALAWGDKIVVRRQNKGQGGKTATFIEGLPPATRDAVGAQVKRALGCAARVDGTALVVGTSEHRRVAQWLEALGAAAVALGN